jgi:hypothetical protein
VHQKVQLHFGGILYGLVKFSEVELAFKYFGIAFWAGVE